MRDGNGLGSVGGEIGEWVLEVGEAWGAEMRGSEEEEDEYGEEAEA